MYAHPRPELRRLTENGVITRVAAGYYVLNPQNRLGDHHWRPAIEAVALGIGQVDYSRDAVALMGVTAARHHGALPRALATAVVAVPKQRPQLVTTVGNVVFVKRDAAKLDLERITTELTAGWVTTIEQTMLDLAARPELGGQPATEAFDAIRALNPRADADLLAELADVQHRPSALRTVCDLIGTADAV
ncbi:type IV toxin-antitoxin system AbiEi family antitoxin domain-containing protein [Actinocrinis sp.]|uniref:type IV toxin-antitoxin system AbiEi family antitoxin domain-containing protein n=1 Tax=Actinocrinis sp. TaxID=1920516 RepID=UPI002D22CC12|nr:type IV toxin-antitoxin system AbiEi family antitoxin [Actinocrinis sp.]HZP52815.1 type IV toxin-antitoxin system AbiEi family antitoxin [Actinocrinis sp.]